MIDLSALCLAWPQGVLVLDELDQISFINKKGSEIVGYSDEQVIGTSITQWLEGNGGSIREEFVTGKLSYLLEHPNVSIPQWWLAQSGEFIEVEARLSILELPTDTVKLITFEEFDDPEQSLFFIRKLAAFPTLSPQPLAQIGLDGSIEYSNEHLNDLMLEYGFNDQGHASIFPNKWQEYVEKCFSTQAPVSDIEHEVSGHWYSWTFHPVSDQAIPFVLLIGTDVTDHIKHKRSLESINRLQQQNNKQKIEYMTTLNAEMQTPLNEIQTHVELLARSETGEPESEWLRNIQYASKVLKGLIDDSEDRLRLEKNELEIRNRVYNPRLVVSQTLEMLAPKIEAKALKYYLWINPRLPMKMDGDAKRLGQLIRVLINNAIDYTERGALVIQLQTRVMASKNWMRFSVTDSGVGISKEKVGQLFSTTANFGHSLPFAKQIVSLMGGQIGAQSVEGRGSSFYVDIPCSEEETQPPIFENQPHVALGIDDKIWKNTIEQYLEFAGVDIVEPSNADLFIGDQDPSNDVAANAFIGQGSPKGAWNYVLASYTPPRLFYDMLQSVLSDEENKTVSELEKLSEESTLDVEPLNLSVLLVDDDEKNLTVFSDAIQSLGCTVVTAISSDEAMTKWFMSGGTIQLILLDCKMPDIDGYQTAEQLRSENFEGPIIGMTNRRWQDEIDDVIRCGMTSCTTKPLDAEELYNLILDLV
jgi:signal transduction histidine kinase/CheY-like chemotaxis protein